MYTVTTDWLDWYDSDPLEMVCQEPDAYHEPTPINGASVGSPVDYHSGSSGHVRYFRDFGGEFPQDVDGLQYAWTLAKTYGSQNTLWSARGGALSGSGIGADSLYRGGRYHGDSGGSNPLFPTSVGATASMSGWVFQPDTLFDLWTGPLFESDGIPDPDPDLFAAWLEYIEANSPGPDWYTEWEKGFPTFVGYQIAADELVSAAAVSDGVILVGINASGTALTVDGDGDYVWEGPGALAAEYLLSYDGGLSDWVDVPDDWMPGQDPVTGHLTPADSPKVVLNCYIESAARLDAGGLSVTIEVDPDSTMPNGYNLDFGKERLYMTFAVKVLWTPPRFRFALDITATPPRRVLARTDAATGGSPRVLGGGNTVQRGNRTLGGIV